MKHVVSRCGWQAHSHRDVTTLSGQWHLTVVIHQCVQPDCPAYRTRWRPEEEGRWALPHGEFGLDIIALIGAWRFREHRSVPEMHQALQARGISIAERSVTHLMHRYEELVALRIADHERLKAVLQQQGRVVVALDGLQPDVGHEVLWIVRDCLSEEILLARPRLRSTQGDVTALLTEVKQVLESWKVPVKGVISDGEETIGSAVAFVFPNVPHQLCHFHASLRCHQASLRGRPERAIWSSRSTCAACGPLNAPWKNTPRQKTTRSGGIVWPCARLSPMMDARPWMRQVCACMSG